MSDFLSRLADRVFAAQPAIRPRLPALFEPTSLPVAPVDERVVSETPFGRSALPASSAIADGEPAVFSRTQESIGPLNARKLPRAEIAPHGDMPQLEGANPPQQPAQVPHQTEPQQPAQVPHQTEPQQPAQVPHQTEPQQPAQILQQTEPQLKPSLTPRVLPPAIPAAASPGPATEPAPRATPRILPPTTTAAPRRPETGPVSVEAKIIRHFAPSPAIEEKSPPVINVTIGRVEVRAIHRPEPPRVPPVSPPSPQPRLSLDRYLEQRRQGKR